MIFSEVVIVILIMHSEIKIKNITFLHPTFLDKIAYVKGTNIFKMLERQTQSFSHEKYPFPFQWFEFTDRHLRDFKTLLYLKNYCRSHVMNFYKSLIKILQKFLYCFNAVMFASKLFIKLIILAEVSNHPDFFSFLFFPSLFIYSSLIRYIPTTDSPPSTPFTILHQIPSAFLPRS